MTYTQSEATESTHLVLVIDHPVRRTLHILYHPEEGLLGAHEDGELCDYRPGYWCFAWPTATLHIEVSESTFESWKEEGAELWKGDEEIRAKAIGDGLGHLTTDEIRSYMARGGAK